MNKIVTWL